MLLLQTHNYAVMARLIAQEIQEMTNHYQICIYIYLYFVCVCM